MRYRRLGRTGLRVSAIGLGTWLTFGRVLDDRTARGLVHRAFDHGVNLFDTADVYGQGAAEEQLGTILRDLPRREIVVATKCFFPMSEAPTDRGLSRKHVIESCHDSLERLGLDHIDLYQCHRPDPDVPLDETLRALEDLTRQGAILHAGVSEWTADGIVDAVKRAEDRGWTPIASDQPCFNMIAREAEERVVPACEAHGLGLLPFSPLAQGVLTGKYARGAEPPPDSRAADERMNTWIGRYLTEETFDLLDELRPIARDLGISLAVLALAWCLRHEAVSSVLVGATKVEHLDENVTAAEVDLSDEAVERIESALDAVS